MKEQKSEIVSSLSYEVIREDPGLMKHFVGLTPSQFEVLFSFLKLMMFAQWRRLTVETLENLLTQRGQIMALIPSLLSEKNYSFALCD